MWTNFFRDGGWGMYPTIGLGFFLVAACVLWMVRPEKRFVPIVAALGLATLGAGLLGTCVGLINTFRFVQNTVQAEQVRIATLGGAESLNNLVLALLIAIPSALLFVIGAMRATLAAGTRDAAA